MSSQAFEWTFFIIRFLFFRVFVSKETRKFSGNHHYHQWIYCEYIFSHLKSKIKKKIDQISSNKDENIWTNKQTKKTFTNIMDHQFGQFGFVFGSKYLLSNKVLKYDPQFDCFFVVFSSERKPNVNFWSKKEKKRKENNLFFFSFQLISTLLAILFLLPPFKKMFEWVKIEFTNKTKNICYFFHRMMTILLSKASKKHTHTHIGQNEFNYSSLFVIFLGFFQFSSVFFGIEWIRLISGIKVFSFFLFCCCCFYFSVKSKLLETFLLFFGEIIFRTKKKMKWMMMMWKEIYASNTHLSDIVPITGILFFFFGRIFTDSMIWCVFLFEGVCVCVCVDEKWMFFIQIIKHKKKIYFCCKLKWKMKEEF